MNIKDNNRFELHYMEGDRLVAPKIMLHYIRFHNSRLEGDYPAGFEEIKSHDVRETNG